MNDYCSNYSDVVGIYKTSEEAQSILTEVHKLNDSFRFLRIKSFVVNFINKKLRFLKKISLVRSFILPYARHISKLIYYKNLYIFTTCNRNLRIINLKIPGAFIQNCIDKIDYLNKQNFNCDYKKEKFRYVIKSIRQIIIQYYPKLKIDFPSDQKLKTYDDHYKWLNETLYPLLEKYKNELRDNIKTIV